LRIPDNPAEISTKTRPVSETQQAAEIAKLKSEKEALQKQIIAATFSLTFLEQQMTASGSKKEHLSKLREVIKSLGSQPR
jgi:hypothetical protein